MRKLFIVLVSLLIAGCSTVQPPVKSISSEKPSITNSTKNSVVQFGSKFNAYPYEPDHFDMMDIKENKHHEVPFTFFKVKF